MRLQTLLPATLFAQSTFAIYYCCFEIQSANPIWNKVSKIFDNIDDEVWYPRVDSDCNIEITKRKATSCAGWKGKVLDNTCREFGALKTLGPVIAKECEHRAG
ncbi:hypothetical protein EG327_001036 [Venturia inaequalis]|uniref:Uncharacterized protein n=1 Tax=Venturia inaequalis TaxID=5025 RepID=A0A8H3Z9L5_VENIN|nr:hypothetical protein EG327_001036 [Venturia inaequalis]